MPGVVDEDVHRPQPANGRLEGARDRRRIAHVADDRLAREHRTTVAVASACASSVACVRPISVRSAPSAANAAAIAAPSPRAAAGDDDVLAAKVVAHVCFAFAMFRSSWRRPVRYCTGQC